jgi:hypothetical protein
MKPPLRLPPLPVHRRVFVLLPLLAAALTAAACAPSARNPYDQGTASRAREGSRRHILRLQVSCAGCSITWQARGQRGTDAASGLWTKTVTVHLQEGEISMARLSASPSPGQGGVSWVRISVDGKVAREERQGLSTGGDPGGARSLTAETQVPPPTGRTEPWGKAAEVGEYLP